MQLSIFSSEELPASPSASPDSERDWMTRAAISCLPLLPWLDAIAPLGWYGRTSPEYCQATEERISVPSSGSWGNAGITVPGECLTLSISEFPSTAAVCSLSDILETGDVQQRYFLSARACAGILRRAEKRGKELPAQLANALTAVASTAKAETDT